MSDEAGSRERAVLREDLAAPPAFRPAPPSRGPGRGLRAVTGVDEQLLAWVPEERARYSRLGAIIVNTGLMAAISIFVALQTFLDVHPLALVVVAAFWGWLILSIDGWLVSSTHGKLGSARLKALAPRLALAVLLGVVIAEPLLMLVFRPAIHQEAQNQRDVEIQAFESLLLRCNPVQGPPPGGAACADALLPVQAGAQAVRLQLEAAVRERDQLTAVVDRDNGVLAAKQELARTECNGTDGPGLTGAVGVGPNCRRNRAEAEQFRIDSRLVENTTRLDQLSRQILDLTGKVGQDNADFSDARVREIRERVQERQDKQQPIGLLEEEKALEALSEESTLVFLGQWLLRLLLIAIDSMPVLAKVLGGTTTYDRLLQRQTGSSEQLHDVDNQLQCRRDTADKEVKLAKVERDVRARIEQMDEDDRVAAAQQEAELDSRIDALAARLRRDPPDQSHPMHLPEQADYGYHDAPDPYPGASHDAGQSAGA